MEFVFIDKGFSLVTIPKFAILGFLYNEILYEKNFTINYQKFFTQFLNINKIIFNLVINYE